MRAATKWGIAAGIGLTIVWTAFVTGRAVAGGIPTSQPLVYSGVLQNADGSPFAATGHNLEIKLWNDATSAAAAALLCTTSAHSLITDSSGHFSQHLGDDCTAKIRANPNVFVEILLDGATLGGKRSRLGAVPYAVEANHALSADSAATAASATNATNANHAASADTAAAAASASGHLLNTVSALQSNVSALKEKQLGFHGVSNTIAPQGAATSATAPFLLQAGTDTPLCGKGGVVVVTFKNPFPHGLISVVLSNGDSTAAGGEMRLSEGHDTKQFRVQTSGAEGDRVRVNWIAVGW